MNPRQFTLFLFLLPQVTYAGLVDFDGTSFPETVGWERGPFLDPIRSLEDGWYVQQFTLIGDRDGYRRPLTEFIDAPYFFAEWRVQTTALSSLLDTTQTPVNLTLGGNGPAFYHTTITDSRVQLLRDTDIPLIFVDIDPDVPHTYRIELFGDELYRWLIDGRVVDSGVPEGFYLNPSAQISWGTRNYEPGITTRWDYIRYGSIPEPATATLLLIGTTLLTLRRKSRTH